MPPSMRSWVVALAVSLTAGCVEGIVHGGEASGETFTIPRIARPRLDRDMAEGEWNGTRVLRGTFNISEGLGRGSYPFEIRLGADAERLFLLLVVANLTTNPYSGVDPESGTFEERPEAFYFFFSEDRDEIRSPSDLVTVKALRPYGNTMDDGYYDSAGHWAYQSRYEPGSFDGGRPEKGRWGMAGWTNDSYFMEVTLPREPKDPSYDGLSVPDAQIFRLLLGFERTCPLRYADLEKFGQGPDCPHGTFPGQAAEAKFEPRTWWRFRIAEA